MFSRHAHRATLALFLTLAFAASVYSQTEDEESERPRPVAVQDLSGVVGGTEVRNVPVRAVNGPALTQATTTQGRAVSPRADSASSLVLQTFQGPVNGNPPDPAMAVGPTNVIATVNSTINIYDKKGTLLSSEPVAVFMFQPTANVWDTHVYYDNVSGHFFVVCATGDQSTTGYIMLAVSTTSDARGGWHLYQLHESKNTWLDFPAPTVTANSLVLSFMDIAAQGTNKFSLCSTEVIGLAELLSGNGSLKIARFDNIFSNGGASCSFAYPAVNYDGGSTAYLAEISESGNSLALARIDTSGSTPVLNVFNIPVASYSFPSGRVPQKGSSTGLIPGTVDVSSCAVRNGSLWATHTVASSGGNSAVRWYEFDPMARSVKQFGEITGVGSAWMGAIAILPDNEADVVYTTSSANDYASAGFAHRSPGDAPNTMPITGVYQAGSGAYAGTRWGDFFEAWADPDGKKAHGALRSTGVQRPMEPRLFNWPPPRRSARPRRSR